MAEPKLRSLQRELEILEVVRSRLAEESGVGLIAYGRVSAFDVINAYCLADAGYVQHMRLLISASD